MAIFYAFFLSSFFVEGRWRLFTCFPDLLHLLAGVTVWSLFTCFPATYFLPPLKGVTIESKHQLPLPSKSIITHWLTQMPAPNQT